MSTWVYRDGQRLTAAMLHDFIALDEEFFRRTGQRLRISDGIRTDEEQERIFRDRYRVQASGNGPFNDVRWWQGQRWVRVKDGGTVAAPGSSNHQINIPAGRLGALDIYDTGRDAGVLTRGSFRANVFDEIAPRHGYDSEGYAFRENWHKRYNRDPWRTVGSTVSTGNARPQPPTTTQEDDMSAEAERQINSIFNAIFRGGDSMKDGGKSISQSLRDIQDKLAPVTRGGQVVTLRQEIASTRTAVIELLGRDPGSANVEVDEAALAAALAPLITDQMRTLSDEDVARLARAASDEADRRARERLDS